MNGNIGKKIVVGVALTVGAADAAMAQTTSGPNPSNIILVVVIGTVNAGIVPMGAVKIVSNVTKWTVDKLVDFSR